MFLLLSASNRFKKKLTDKSILERETVVFEIEMFDARAPLKWYKNGEELKPNDRISFKYADNIQQLIITGATMEDAGEYMAATKEIKSKAMLTVAEGKMVTRYRVHCTILNSCILNINS